MKIGSVDIILLGHGSRRGKDTDLGLEEIRRRLQLRFSNGLRVRMAGLEFTPPSLEEAVLRLTHEGSKGILIMPFFLFRGKHLKEEIPQDIVRINRIVPEVSLRLTGNLGLDPRLIDIVEERIASVLQRIQGGRLLRFARNDGVRQGNDRVKQSSDRAEHDVYQGVSVVLVRRGSRPEYDDGQELFKLAKDISQRLRLPVEPAQAQFGHPTVAEAIQDLIKPSALDQAKASEEANSRFFDLAQGKSSLKKIIVMPYLFFPGKVLFDNVVVETDKASSLYPQISFSITPTLGVDERLVDIAMDRIRAATGRPGD